MLFTIASIDPFLGRPDLDSLSDQSRMELFMSTLSENSIHPYFSDGEGGFEDCCDWKRVGCDESGHVIEITWVLKKFAKLTEFHLLPPTVRILHLSLNRIAASFDLSVFPTALEDLDIGGNVFEGSLTFGGAPPRLAELHVPYNQLSGSVDFSSIPRQLIVLKVSVNSLHGSIDLTALPPGLCDLRLNSNIFSGSICLESLPSNIDLIDLSMNDLEGPLDFGSLPESLRRLNITSNKFTLTRDQEVPACIVQRD